MTLNNISLLQTEKAYNMSQSQVFVLAFSGGFIPNKIELAKILKRNGLNPIKINVVNLPSKVKIRGQKRRTILKTRPTKYYIKLKPGEVLNEDKVTQIFANSDQTIQTK